jgi:glycosyltransferase involved in cell wall biosynthesis
MQPINVLYLVRTWAFGGSHTIVLSLLEHMPQERFNIHCVPYDAHSSGDVEFIEQAAARNIPIDDARIPWRSNRDWFRARRTVSKLIHEYNIDLIHTHDPHSNMLVGLGRNRWPVPVIASAYGWWDGAMGRRRLHQRIERDIALPNFDRVITVSEDMSDRIREGNTPTERIRIVHTGLADQPPTPSTLRAEFNIDDEAIVIGTIGRVSEEKGHRHLIDAVHALRNDVPKLHCIIVGTGPALDQLKQQTSNLELTDQITFTGFWNDRADALQAFNIFALPSVEREGLPTSVLEAQQAGLPVIASDIGGTREAIDPDRTGLLVEPGNVEALTDTLRGLLFDVTRRPAMGRAGRAWITERFSMQNMIDNVTTIYDEAINDARSH